MSDPETAAAAPNTDPAPSDTPPAGENASTSYSTLNPPPAEGDPPADNNAPDAGDPPQGAPENYEAFNLPEGIEISEENLNKFVPLAKELNLSQEQAQKLIDLQTEINQQATATLKDAQVKAMADQRAEWVQQMQTDKEFGGPDLQKNLGLANKALARFAGIEMRQILHDSGLSDHPEMVRTFFKIGKLMEEDSFKDGEARSAPVSLAKKLYPDLA